MGAKPRRSVGRARAAERRLDAQALILQARLRLRRVLACRGHAGSTSAYRELLEMAGDVDCALRDLRAALAIVVAVGDPMLEVDPPDSLAHDLARDPRDLGRRPARGA